MNEITRWLESLGISPLMGGLVIGAVIVFLLTRRSRSQEARPLGSAPGKGKTGKDLAGYSQSFSPLGDIRIENHEVFIELPPEVASKLMSLVRDGHKIDAIKQLREATGTDLTTAKQMIDALERSGIGR